MDNPERTLNIGGPLVTDLSRFLGPTQLSIDPTLLARHSYDALGEYRASLGRSPESGSPDVIVYPDSTEQVSEILSFASSRGIPVIPYGGGTGVMGGVVPVNGGIMLNMQRMKRVVEINRESGYFRVEAGAILEDISAILDSMGLLFGHDPWSRPIATVGGAISTNGVGYLAGTYGNMGEQVIGLQVVLSNGDVLAEKLVSGIAGPNLANLFIGSEGTLGIITRATVRAYPKPEAESLAAYSFPNFETGFHAIQELFSFGLTPSVVDYAEERDPALTDGEKAKIILYLGFHGVKDEVDEHTKTAGGLCKRFGGVSLPKRVAIEFWKTRHQSAHRYKRHMELHGYQPQPTGASRYMDYLHVAIPSARVLEYREFCKKLLDSKLITVREWSLWGRQEYFSLLIQDSRAGNGESPPYLAAIVNEILITAQDMGGSMEYCHGIGYRLNHLVQREMGTGGINALRSIKRALDPSLILNPGKLDL